MMVRPVIPNNITALNGKLFIDIDGEPSFDPYHPLEYPGQEVVVREELTLDEAKDNEPPVDQLWCIKRELGEEPLVQLLETTTMTSADYVLGLNRIGVTPPEGDLAPILEALKKEDFDVRMGHGEPPVFVVAYDRQFEEVEFICTQISPDTTFEEYAYHE